MKKPSRRSFSLFFKGLGMGAANVIPGVSGGTIALITGIYEELILAVKAFDIGALRLLLKGRWAALAKHVNAPFLIALGAGVGVSIFSLAMLLEFLLEVYEVATMAFFFGLIVPSVYFVGRTVGRWGAAPLLAGLAGTAVAAGVALLHPAAENPDPFYVFLCGVAAICSMVLPGLSGSFVLLVMGNYGLVLGAIGALDLGVLAPLAAGCAVGIVAFSHVLAWLLKRYRDATVAAMTGFVLGSLLVIWPWKTAQTEAVAVGPGGESKVVVTGYRWEGPAWGEATTWVALGLVAVGAGCIIAMERWTGRAGTESGGPM